MLPEVIVALIAAVTSLVGSITTLIIGFRSIRVEREKLQADRERLGVEAERLRSEMAKLGVETEKLRSEVDDVRRLRLGVERAILELETQKAMDLQERQRNIYAEMIELVYRLRNTMRQRVNTLKGEAEAALFWSAPNLGEELYHLTDNLYKYRVFIDEETFQMLHKYKRLLQDAQVLFNRMTRLPDDFPEGETEGLDSFEAKLNVNSFARYQESSEQIDEIYHEVDALYPQITKRVKSHIETVLRR